MSKINVDFIGHDGAQGEVASLLLSQGRLDPNRMRPWLDEKGRSFITVCKGNPKKESSYSAVPSSQLGVNATLRRDEWKQLDEAALAESQYRLGGIDDLVDNNLVFDLGNGMAKTVLEYHDIGDAMEAEMTMDAVPRGKGDRPIYGTNYLPLPIIHSDFEINLRELEASRALGDALDTTAVELATRRVREKVETLLFTAASTTYTFGGGSIYGYLDQPYRNQYSLDANWDASATTGSGILTDVIGMKQAAINDRHYGPFMLYIPTAYETVLDEDYTSGYPQTIRQRLLQLSGIKGIKVIDTLTANNVVLVQMTKDVVRLVRGMGIQVVEWKTEGGFVSKYKVLQIAVPQVRSTQGQRSGIVHGS